MKAFLLSAGLGTRLRPITLNISKCLVEIQGKPLIYWWIKLFEKHGITDVLINTHHFGGQVVRYISEVKSNVSWSVFNEKELLGSAGTLRENKSFVKDDDEFLIMYGDVLTNCNLTNLINFHKENKSPFTITLAETDNPTSKGIAEVGDNGIVTGFIEKPTHPISNLANMGIYVCTPPILELIDEKPYSDIATDLLPSLIGKMLSYKSNEYFCDIGTIENLKMAENTFIIE
jgi:mannose-1-phosphate guanylyltransferase